MYFAGALFFCDWLLLPLLCCCSAAALLPLLMLHLLSVYTCCTFVSTRQHRFSCKAEFLGTGVSWPILDIFSNTIYFRDGLDKGHNNCSDLTSIGGGVGILSFHRVFFGWNGHFFILIF